MKKMIFSALIVMMALISGATLVHAQVYRYTDENGQKRWTDDPGQISNSGWLSAQLTEMDLSDDDPEPVPRESTLKKSAPRKPDLEESTPTLPDDAPEPQNWTAPETVDRGTLEAEKAELDRIYKELEEERKIIAEKRAEYTKPVNRAALNTRTQIYNEKTADYATRVDEYNKKVEGFNRNLTQTRKTDEFGRPVDIDEPHREKEEIP